MAYLFHVVIYQPIYNALAFIISLVPGADIGIGIVVITILVRLVLFPLSLSAIKSQIQMRRIDPELKELDQKYKDDKQELAKKKMELLKQNNINPFAGVLLILAQLPVIIGLYTVLRSEIKSLNFDPTVLYSFVHAPEHASLIFLGFLDLAGKSIVLAVIVAGTQFLYARLLKPSQTTKPVPSATPSFQEDLANSMQMQMLYIFPILFGFIAYFASSAIALYFLTSNVFSIAQELVIQKLHGKR